MPIINSSLAESQTIPEPTQSLQLTPELVKKIADRVYALMLAETRIERERQRYSAQKLRHFDGGHYGV